MRSKLFAERSAAGHVLDLPGFETRLDRQQDAFRAAANEALHGSCDSDRPGAPLLCACEAEVFAFGAITFVAERGHHLVIAEEHGHLSADLASLALQSEK